MNKHTLPAGIISFLGCFFLILDRDTAMAGILQGMKLCATSVIPGLFPFFFLTSLMCFSLRGRDMPILSPLRKCMGIPEGGDYLLIPAFLGGYPMGAKAVSEAYSNGILDAATAHRLLFFCNNGGPAFFFGMLPAVLDDKKMIFCLWFLHVVSAILISLLLPGKMSAVITAPKAENINLSEVMTSAVRSTAMVCGWILIFRMVIKILERWILWRLPVCARVICCGVLELTNGCISLIQLEPVSLRFVLASAFIGWGGVCAAMQTASILGKLSCSSYLTGKLLHSLFSAVLAFSVVSGHFILGLGAILTLIFLGRTLQNRGRKILPYIV